MKENIKGLNFSSDVTLAESYEKYIDEINSLIEEAEKCQQLINSYDKVNDDEYYNEIKSFPYGTKLDHSDYLKIIELANNKKYEKPISIKTSTKTLVPVDTGYGKDIETRLEYRGVDLKVLYTKESKINDNTRYTKSEIEELVNNKEIVVLKVEIDWEACNCDKYEDCPVYRGVFQNYNVAYEFEEEKGIYYNDMLKYNRIKNSKENLNKIFKELLLLVRAKLFVRQALESDFESKGFQKKIGELESK